MIYYIVQLLGSQVELVKDLKTNEPMAFMSRKEANFYGQAHCAWAYRIVGF